MIIELLLTLILDVVTFFINLIPDIELPAGFISGFGDVANLLDGVSYVLPIGTFLACTTVFFVLHNLTLIVSIINWIIAKIPGIS